MITYLCAQFQKKFYARILKNKASKKLGKKSKLTTEGTDESKQSSLTTMNDDKMTKNVVLRHSGVLGLCAFVKAYPYDIPEFIPDILVFLSGYIHEVQPISVSLIFLVFIKLVTTCYYNIGTIRKLIY